MKSILATTLLFLVIGTAQAQLEYEGVLPNPFQGVGSRSQPLPALADIDTDGDLDLVVGAQGDNIMRYYRNEGTAEAPSFVEVTVDNPFSVYSNNAGVNRPVFIDIDNDNDLDFFVGNWNVTPRYYENTGTTTDPVFAFRTGESNPLGIVLTNDNMIGLAFADLDNDGDYDAHIGDEFGAIYYYENTGTATDPMFVENNAASPLASISEDFTGRTRFIFLDVDENGTTDLLVGQEASGELRYYKNTGTASAPVFSYQAEHPLSTFFTNQTAFDARLHDLDDDGLLDVVLGGNSLISFHQLKATGSIINFTDAAFKTALIDPELGVDLDKDGEITTNEASAFGPSLAVDDAGITDMREIRFFTSLTSLSASQNSLTTIPLTQVPGIVEVDASGNMLNTLPIASDARPEVLILSDNSFGSFNVGAAIFAELRVLDLSGNSFGGFLTNTERPALEELYLTDVGLGQLILNNMPNLSKLHIGGNEVGQIVVPDLSNLSELFVDGSEVLSILKIEQTGSPVSSFSAVDNPNLQCINVADEAAWTSAHGAGLPEGVIFSEACPYTLATVSDVSLKGVVIEAISIDDQAETITITVPFGTDVSSLVPVFTFTDGRSFDYEDPFDFTSPVDFLTRSQDGSSEINYSVTVVFGEPVSRADLASTLRFGPNPSRGLLTVSGYGGRLALMSAQGQRLMSLEVSDGTLLDLRRLAPGLYLLQTAEGHCHKLIIR